MALATLTNKGQVTIPLHEKTKGTFQTCSSVIMLNIWDVIPSSHLTKEHQSLDYSSYLNS